MLVVSPSDFDKIKKLRVFKSMVENILRNFEMPEMQKTVKRFIAAIDEAYPSNLIDLSLTKGFPVIEHQIGSNH